MQAAPPGLSMAARSSCEALHGSPHHPRNREKSQGHGRVGRHHRQALRQAAAALQEDVDRAEAMVVKLNKLDFIEKQFLIDI
ncbi:MAG TPA: hypothetical protein VKI18_16945 [Albitalea sp.]|nr:hypothetical protein [Albitalea sp.]